MTRLLRALRLTVVHLALAALGCWAVASQLVYRIPSRWVSVVLVAVAAAFTGLTLALWLRALLDRAAGGARRFAALTLARGACALVILGLSFYGVFLFTNGMLDTGDTAHYPTEVVHVGLDETTIGLTVPFVWADVRSWRRPGELERVVLQPGERERLWGGQAVVVSVRPGFYNVPWVSRIEADVEKRSREVLAVLPEAAQIRKDLAEFYARLGRYPEAAITTREYARRFPEDREFPIRMAKALTGRARYADVVTVLGDVAPQREDADVYMLLGYALAMQGQAGDGVPLLERARGMRPKNWWPHWALGWAYGGGGDYARAVASFQKALELRPGLADAERELQRLRPLAARTPAR